MNNIQKAYERLHRKGTDEIVDYAYELEQQLQSYKSKEDKLREIEPLKTWYNCENNFENSRGYIDGNASMVYEKINEIIQMLNEGDK